MRWVHLAVIILFATATIVFAAQNLEIVSVSFLRIRAQIPLAFLIALMYLLGAVSGGSVLALVRWSIEGAKRRTAASP
jgi:putative membrane protein